MNKGPNVLLKLVKKCISATKDVIRYDGCIVNLSYLISILDSLSLLGPILSNLSLILRFDHNSLNLSLRVKRLSTRCGLSTGRGLSTGMFSSSAASASGHYIAAPSVSQRKYLMACFIHSSSEMVYISSKADSLLNS